MKRIFVVPIALVLVVIVIAVIRYNADSPSSRKPVAISAESKIYNSLSELIDASDLVVIAKATEETDGRVVGSDSKATIRTKLVTLRVGEVLKGEYSSNELVLEQEDTLGDGRPVIVNGVMPTKTGDEGIFFLAGGKGEEFPYFALLNDQSRYLITGEKRDQLKPSSNDPLAISYALLGPYELRCQVTQSCTVNR